MAKVKKYDLSLDEEQPFEVYGISTAFADYRLCWELNQCLEILLEKQNDPFEFYLPKLKSKHPFNYFLFENHELLTRFYLIKNKQEQQHLYADRPMIDFFLVLKENFSHQPNELIEKLKRRISQIRVGDPLDKNTDLGAINSAGQLARIKEISSSFLFIFSLLTLVVWLSQALKNLELLSNDSVTISSYTFFSLLLIFLFMRSSFSSNLILINRF